MKKLFAAMFAVCLGFVFFAFAGCAAAPTEEDFTAAQDALDNYTVVVEFDGKTAVQSETILVRCWWTARRALLKRRW